ncbi:MAG TPA: tetratricopeptide repeat protein [Micromonosporaceae bacterium]|nr:tetratricopeptide repeat protein [Micromonosporaceae bacterium]
MNPDNQDITVVQNVTATGGVAYGVVGADLHVYGDGVPVYLLEEFRVMALPDSGWLRELPSRILNAHYRVVPLVGRGDEFARLVEWRQSAPRLAVEMIHGPGGQGKSRLVEEFSTVSLADGWKVARATLGSGSLLPLPGSQDLRLGDAAGLVIVVDYADRWPLSSLVWLLSNSVVYGTHPVRVLLLSRTAGQWTALRGALDRRQIALSVHYLEPLSRATDSRNQVYSAAIEAFSSVYGLRSQPANEPAFDLTEFAFDVTLAILVAALVAVDVHSSRSVEPTNQADLTSYLLDRERHHWTILYENAVGGIGAPGSRLDFMTPPTVMEKAVFVAALTGEVAYSMGVEILDGLDLELPATRVIQDHGVCYPSPYGTAGAVLSPLYPDRLAEDFLALTLAGSLSQTTFRPWASHVLRTMLAEHPIARPEAWTKRAILFLVAAVERWPGMGPIAYEILVSRPELAMIGGSDVLVTLSKQPALPYEVLEAVESVLPDGSDPDLDLGIAAVMARLTDHRLIASTNDIDRADSLNTLAVRLGYAGLWDEALRRTTSAIELLQGLGSALPTEVARQYVRTLNSHAVNLKAVGRDQDALSVNRATSRIYSQLWEQSGLVEDASGYAFSLNNLALSLLAVGEREAALEAISEAVRIRRDLVVLSRAAFEGDLASSVANLGLCLAELGKGGEALDASREALELYRNLGAGTLTRYAQDGARTLTNTAADLIDARLLDQGLKLAREAADVHRKLASTNLLAFGVDLARTLITLSTGLTHAGLHQDSADAAAEAVDVMKRFRRSYPDTSGHDLASALNNLADSLARLGRWAEARSAAAEALDLSADLVNINAPAHLDVLAQALDWLAICAAATERLEEAASRGRESVWIHERLAEAYPRRFLRELVNAVTNLGGYLQALELWEESAGAIERLMEISIDLQRHRMVADNLHLALAAVRLSRQISERVDFQVGLANSLNCLSVALLESGRAIDSFAAADEAVSLFDPLVAASYAVRIPRFVAMLANRAAALIVLDRSDDARASALRALELCQGYHLAELSSEERQPLLGLSFLAYLLERLDLITEAEWARSIDRASLP